MNSNRDDVQKILAEAHSAVKAVDLPEDLQPVAFGKAVDLLAGTVAQDARGTAAAAGDTTGDGGRIDKIAKKLGIDTKMAEFFFDPDDDDVTMVVPRSKLDSNKSAATQEVTLLYCGARQAGGYDESHTSTANIRSQVENMGVLDATNFAKHLKDIEGLSIRGAGQKREFKVTSHGYELATALAKRIKGGA